MKCEPRDKTQETRLLGQHMFEAESKAPIRVLSRNEAAAITNPGATGSTAFGNNFIVSLCQYYILFALPALTIFAEKCCPNY